MHLRGRPPPLLATMLATLLAACGSGAGSSDNPSRQSDPAQVAVKFVTTLYGGHTSDALTLVAPNQRKVLGGLPRDYPAGALSARDVRAGSVTIRGTSARVPIFGTTCVAVRPGPGLAVEPAADHCVTHGPGNPGGDDFAQYLVKIDGSWYISAKDSTSFK